MLPLVTLACHVWSVFLVCIQLSQCYQAQKHLMLFCMSAHDDRRFWDNHWLWWTAPFVGGLTAGKLYTKFWLPKDQLPDLAKKAMKKVL